MGHNSPPQGQPKVDEAYDKTGLNDLLSDGDDSSKADMLRKKEERDETGKSQKDESKPQTNQSNPLNRGQYIVQVATFSDKSTAQSEINRLIKMEPKLFKNKKFAIQYLELGSHKKPVYRVVVGSFGTSNQAAQFRSRLKVHNVKGIVIKLAEPPQ
jgi:cell division protein FtsN